MISAEITRTLEEVARRSVARRNLRRPATCDQLQAALAQVLASIKRREFRGNLPAPEPEGIFWVRAINGALARQNKALFRETADADANFVRALSTGTGGGQYMVPTVEANSFIEMLSFGSTMRKAGATVWPLEGIEDFTIPVGVTSPSWVFMAQNSRQTPDAAFNLAQISFSLKEHRALVPLNAQLFKSARPSLESLLPTFLALGAAESEDAVFHSSTTLTDSPLALMAASGVTFVNCGGSANGASLAYSDILATVEKAAETKLRFPWCWFASPRTWMRIFSLASTTSQPLLGPPTTEGGNWTLLGWPLYLTNSISNAETLGSGSALSHLVLCNPQSIHVGEDHTIRFDVSEEMQFDANIVNLRLIHHIDVDFQPRAGFVILRGIA